MPVGIIVNCLSVALGGWMGAVLTDRIPERFKTQLTQIFGLCALGMGISSVILMKNMPAVVFSVVVGTALGLGMDLGGWISKGAGYLQKPVAKLVKNQNIALPQEEYTATLVTVIVLFCASGTGIYGSLDSGISGDHTILMSKSILDFFTAVICLQHWHGRAYGGSAAVDRFFGDFCFGKNHLSLDYAGDDRGF